MIIDSVSSQYFPKGYTAFRVESVTYDRQLQNTAIRANTVYTLDEPQKSRNLKKSPT